MRKPDQEGKEQDCRKLVALRQAVMVEREDGMILEADAQQQTTNMD